MNLADLPTFHEKDIHTLKADLQSKCEQYSIVKFEPEDIIELLEDGESPDWVAEQLQDNIPQPELESFRQLLNDIQQLLGPIESEPDDADVDVGEETVQAEMDDSSEAATIPTDLSQIDFSQIDLSELGDMVPGGMTLPQGIDMKQVEQLLKSPQGQFMADFSLFVQEKGIDVHSMNDPKKMQALEAEWRETPSPTFGGRTPAEMLAENPSLMPQKVGTYRREEPRIGRNDPCPCGSGKKYKKCCGRRK